ncbi:MAG TPA: hypothetical protein PKN36_01980 [bacterium]|nr:hypothetical protein [bacterium]
MNKKICLFCGKPAKLAVIVMQEGKEEIFHFCGCCSEEGDFYRKLESVSGGYGKTKSLKYCPGCGYSYKDFKEYRFLGCPECYRSFSRGVTRYLKNIHSSLSYKGKTPLRHYSEKRTRNKNALSRKLGQRKTE